MMADVTTLEDARIFIAHPGMIEKIEQRVRIWIKKLKDIMLESKQVRRESDSSGPQQELEYWKRRGSQFSQLVSRLEVFLFGLEKLLYENELKNILKTFRKTAFKIAKINCTVFFFFLNIATLYNFFP